MSDEDNKSNVIDFQKTVQQKKNESKDQYVARLEAELTEARKKLGQLVSINEYLKLQLNDLISQLELMHQNIKFTHRNAVNMKNRLPNISAEDLRIPPKK